MAVSARAAPIAVEASALIQHHQRRGLAFAKLDPE
jgi:hypothetical protein